MPLIADAIVRLTPTIPWPAWWTTVQGTLAVFNGPGDVHWTQLDSGGT